MFWHQRLLLPLLLLLLLLDSSLHGRCARASGAQINACAPSWLPSLT